MSKVEYKNLVTFHPGYYIKDIINEMEISQDEFATRMGVSGKTLSLLVNGKISLSNEMASLLSIMLGTSVDVWLNMQKKYDEKILEMQKEKRLDDEIELVRQIDYSYFTKLNILPETRDITEKVKNLCSFLKVSSLNVLSEEDFLVNYRTGITNIEKKNIINSRIWLQTAINFGKNIETEPFNAKKLKAYLPEIREMTVKLPQDFMPRLREIFKECGVSFVLLPSLKNAGINGAVKWVNNEKVILAMNNRRTYADTFWFSLFHEIKHVLQQKIKLTMISGNADIVKRLDDRLEQEADIFAQEQLIPKEAYEKFLDRSNFTADSIKAFANELKIQPGIVVGRLQKESFINYYQHNDLKQKYTIKVK
ncbi:HigA family addiction module antitoxin [Velocimicrobium porci]|uniref:HigA family addiction module antidote protein n=1 Tax=Velocimicrobium porci TaxID=2606634 RepID=A0A6L5Y106_9FIRM|nr:HigA family addiction module antitoxin [Velocimicrobium porci]MSS64614.1 HigA family addiction module antidote protein [Velocimicrobium porci]